MDQKLVGIPVYNGDWCIAQSIESMLSQTFEDLEVIISDNASTDRTERICRKYAGRDPRVRYYRSDVNRGASWNHNRVVELARGQFFRWQCHDDYSDPTLIEKCLAVVENDPKVVLCYSQFVRVDEQGRQLGIKSSRLVGTAEPHERFRSMIYRRDSCEEIYGVTRTAVIRKTALLRPYSNSDDTFLAELILHGQFREIPEPLFFYRIHQAQSTKAYPSRAGRMAWFRTSARTCFCLPFAKLLAGYISVVWRSPVVWREKIRCYSYLVGWAWHFRDWFTEDLHVIRVSLINDGLVRWLKQHAPWTRPVWHGMKSLKNRLSRPDSAAARAKILRGCDRTFRLLTPSNSTGSTKKRVLFLRRAGGFGGSEIVIVDLLKAIDYKTNVVSVASTVDVFSKVLTDLRLPVTCLPLTARFTGGFVRMFMSWIRYLMRLRPDKIILAEGGFRDFPFSTALAAFAITRGNVWMMELHPAPEPTKNIPKMRLGFLPRLRLPERTRGRLARGILSISQGIKERLVESYGYAPEKIDVVYCGVDTARFSPASEDYRRALRRELQIPDEAVVIVSTARLDPIKRLDRLIEAFGTLSLRRSDFWLLVTGDGPLGDELKALAQSVNNRENIRFLGHVEDVCAILRASDIYVLPSDEEGFGIALAEAMACKLVCVATKTVGPSEIIEDGLNGFLVDPTYEGVLKGLHEALRLGHKEREMLGNRARQRVIDNFRVEQAAAKGLAFMQITPSTRIVR